MCYRELHAGEVCVVGGRRFEAISVNHIVPTVGYRVESPEGKAFAFTGDTTTNDTFWAALNAHDRLDLLLLEVAFSNVDETLSRAARHYCSKTLAEDVVKLRHRPDIYLTHHKPAEEARIYAEVLDLVSGLNIKQLKNQLVFTL